MFRINYTNLNKQQVEDALSKSIAPVCASEFCTDLAGKKLKIVLDKIPVEGPTLEYAFETDTKLTVKENDGAAITCDYGAHSLKDIILFSHMVTGTKRGYTVIINRKTSVVTVFEMWFIDYEGEIIDTATKIYAALEVSGLKPFVNREVQRQCYYGYVEELGKTPPDRRDTLSLRLENSMIKWDEDRGKKRLTTYTSTTFSTFVELDTPDGGDVLTFVSDILQINETTFIHCFGEVEYSGRLSVEVLDIFSMKKIGASIGIDENDNFEFALYKGCGEFLGRYSTYSDFNDKGDQYSDFARKRIDFSVRGARQSYRPSIMAKKITEEDLCELAKEPAIYNMKELYGEEFSTENVPDDTDYCVGKNITFRGDDGFCIDLEFKSATELAYRITGETEWHSEQYHPVEIDEDLIILGFYRSGSFPPAALFFAFDFKNGCATCLDFRMGTKYNLCDVDTNYHFGVIEMEGLTPLRIFRQGFTYELLGRAFTRSWHDGMTSIHIYNAPHSYSWTITNSGEPGSPAYRAGGPVWSAPCEYIKLRDNVYIMNWVQQKWDGLQGLFCLNLRTGHDSGVTLSVYPDGKKLYFERQGCISRPAGNIDLSGIYPLGNYNSKA